jgi:aspartate/methionine/tyrosine aminotransferase
MSFETFILERTQSLHENDVEINLTESGVEPLTLAGLLSPAEIEALLTLRLGYNHTEGTPELREAIASWYPVARPENVLVTTGAAEANFIACWTLMEGGGAIAMMLPNFMQIHGLGAAFDHEVRPFHLLRAEGWRPDLTALEAALADGEVRLIALCNPSNPVGSVLSEADMTAIVDLARQADAWILSDEIYRGAELDGRPETPTFWGRYDKVIVTASTSKALAHAGLRLGWMTAPAAFVAEAMKRQDYTSIGTGPINQFVAAKLLSPSRRPEILARSRAILGGNLEIIDAWVSSWNGRLTYTRPAAGGMAFIGYDFAINSTDLVMRLLKERDVFVVAGDWFGLDGHIRIGTGGEPHVLREGLSRIDALLKTLA